MKYLEKTRAMHSWVVVKVMHTYAVCLQYPHMATHRKWYMCHVDIDMPSSSQQVEGYILQSCTSCNPCNAAAVDSFHLERKGCAASTRHLCVGIGTNHKCGLDQTLFKLNF